MNITSFAFIFFHTKVVIGFQFFCFNSTFKHKNKYSSSKKILLRKTTHKKMHFIFQRNRWLFSDSRHNNDQWLATNFWINIFPARFYNNELYSFPPGVNKIFQYWIVCYILQSYIQHIPCVLLQRFYLLLVWQTCLGREREVLNNIVKRFMILIKYTIYIIWGFRDFFVF